MENDNRKYIRCEVSYSRPSVLCLHLLFVLQYVSIYLFNVIFQIYAIRLELLLHIFQFLIAFILSLMHKGDISTANNCSFMI